ncbi:hypothetical protein [Saccharomonospora xinjiangensis]|uniref:Integral membrane protein n=1 Tax=Saccharomonospora xinjiangensis XJ-54 TaxID=882086 RepID=I0UXY4_9PSEU|nr:hypothetical protein [Saccharomonospora xinjiangensis]EID52737.1 hypothetical protein SacxiDRAFT_0461 [Saccharomonospora xinjiangensis XJ-54]
MRRRRGWAVAIAVAGVVAASFAVTAGLTREPAQDSGREQVAEPVAFAADVVDVVRTGERSVRVVVELPSGGEDCGDDVRVEHVQDALPDRPDTVYANVMYSAPMPDVGACRGRRTAEVPLTVSAPLGERMLVFNAAFPAWTPDGDRYRRCDDLLGCHPPEDTCDPVWIDKAVYQLDVPVKRLRSVREVRACDGTWLILDVNPAAGRCAPDGGECEPGGDVARWFLRFDRDHWETVLRTSGAGCTGLDREFTDLPTELCATLPAP